MENMSKKIVSFKDLDVWKEGHQLAVLMYETTKYFPKEEIFGITSQMRRAAVSVTSNIAEGFGRQSYKDKHHFYQISLGSLLELESQLCIAKDVGYLSEEKFCEIINQIQKVETINRGLLRKTKSLYA